MRNGRGFSLLEIVLASLLFSVLVVFVTSIWSLHARIIGKSRTRMLASFLAQKKLEEEIQAGYYNAVNITTTGLNITTTMRGTVITTPYFYNVTVVNETDPTGVNMSMKLVTVTCAFPDEAANSTNKEVTYETKLGKPNRY